MNLTWMLERSARTFADKPAIVSDLGTLDYRELLAASRRAAAVFRDAGVQPGDRIGVMAFNTPAFVVAAFGLWRAGAALVPINHKLTAREVAYIAEHAGLRLVVADVDVADRVREGAPDARVLTCTDDAAGEFDVLVAAAEEWDGVDVAGDAIAEVLYTSGTTSSPKGCLHTHEGLSNVPAYTAAAVGLQREDRFLIAMPIWHASPLNNWFLSMMYLGGTVVLLKEYHPVHFLQAVQQHRVTAFFGAPIAYLAPLKVLPGVGMSLTDFDLSSMRLWAYGGAPLGADTVRTLQAAYGSDNFYQVYGMSEMGPVGSALYPAEQIAKAGAIGAGGMPGVDIRVVSEDGLDVAADHVGELWMRSSTRMAGYLHDEAATDAVFVDDWYRTGDLARVDADGYLFIVDRLKDVVITGGENVYSPEVEEALRQHPAVTDAAVIGRVHAEWGETVVAVVESTGDLDLDEVRTFLADHLAKYKIPRELIVRETLPRNPSGKVTKHVLRGELV
ncbi:AMP-binding protein [Microbacterium sp. H1-D42]|uniref:class I adenylate-forming enzyme family protein n=1 Tax=Microbacterium sp. H1-D42 TaxID=2925844 RepID=UPI001F535D8B|nr:AMP-binding protein [Microbacterium sp. H1-D42]UNK71747.1 AMP-binding protein [Microbacterium sp. H1-D42]